MPWYPGSLTVKLPIRVQRARIPLVPIPRHGYVKLSLTSLFSSTAIVIGEPTSGIQSRNLRTETGNFEIRDGEYVEVLRSPAPYEYLNLIESPRSAGKIKQRPINRRVQMAYLKMEMLMMEMLVMEMLLTLEMILLLVSWSMRMHFGTDLLTCYK